MEINLILSISLDTFSSKKYNEKMVVPKMRQTRSYEDDYQVGMIDE